MSKIIAEGEKAPFGYGFVKHRYDCLGVQIAPLPLNYLIRWIDNWQGKSYIPATKKELNAIKAVRELQIQANAKGYERGLKDGRDWTVRVYEEQIRPTPVKEQV